MLRAALLRRRGQLFFQLSLRLEPKARFELTLTGYGPVVLPLHHFGEQNRGTSPVLRLAAWAPGERIERPFLGSGPSGLPLADPGMSAACCEREARMVFGEVCRYRNRRRTHSPVGQSMKPLRAPRERNRESLVPGEGVEPSSAVSRTAILPLEDPGANCCWCRR